MWTRQKWKKWFCKTGESQHATYLPNLRCPKQVNATFTNQQLDTSAKFLLPRNFFKFVPTQDKYINALMDCVKKKSNYVSVNKWATKTNMDVRYRTLGLCFYIQHRCHSVPPIQATPDYHKSSMVRFKPYPPPRATRPTSSQGLPGTDCYPSLNSGLESQRPCGTTSTPVIQQATKTTMDIWWATLRLRRWTPPSPPPTNNRTLAHRKRCIHVFWLLIMNK